ncbi:argininosuccinate lyase [Caballeronia catudaia]|uniref:Argininosuccinate lyase n=1 Tax=Caballeronia catudaia TaxID=1777136 RepID=A0A158BS56_9BURK|nr:ATP-grasp domain-containing protein [Caballeronia catudaia]SAK72087.1 argininosuccinate lyase [Caballeronia catudaia]
MDGAAMKNDGVLLLSHCGYSFIEDLVAALNARGLRSFVLSSSPLSVHRERRLDQLSRMTTRLIATESPELTSQDVSAALDELHEKGERVLACISVWEGYRDLMGQANAELGVADLAPIEVLALRDKLGLRNRLANAGLSRARAVELTRENFDALKSDGRHYFVKPVCGIASYGAFSLRSESEWSDIERISDEARRDETYRSAFGKNLSFMAEDYVPGREFSFELLAVDARLHTVAIHEKCEMTETAGTVLEDCCVSPPISINSDVCAAGMRWVSQLFDELELRWSCFHLEARYDGSQWDLIEINPRVGGCLISPSVKALTGVASMLEMWLDLLMAAADKVSPRVAEFDRKIETVSYRGNGVPSSGFGTFFRAYFARPGHIDFIGLRSVEPAPIVSQLFLKKGDDIEQASREVFLGQLLWRVPRQQCESQLPDLMRISAEAVEVRYAVDARLAATSTNDVLESML